MIRTLVLVAALGAGVASADTIDLDYQQVAGGSGATQVSVNGTTYYAGHMIHNILSGPNAGSSFRTFCIELGELASTGPATYDIVNLGDAPLPGTPYGQAKANAVSAVIANAIAEGWIGADLQGDTNQADYTAKMGAIQAAVWEALGASVNLNSSQTSQELAYYYYDLMNGFDASLRTTGLRAVVARGQQDMLYIVPLPPAAIAGAGLLAVGFGVRALRRR